jgi:hypothetical protein
MKKTIIFGASNGGINFMKNSQEDREFLAFVDNDIAKQKKKLLNLQVISPTDISNYDYDEIIIASIFGLEIKKQLLNLGIDKSKIILPPKCLFRTGVKYPFEDEKTLQIARKFTKTIASRAYDENIPLHINWGTLIGVLRDGDLIKWDDDIDFSSLLEYKTKIEKFINNLKDELESMLNASIEIVSYEKPGIKIICKSKLGNFHTFDSDINFKIIKDDKALQFDNQMWYTSAKHILKLETFNWDGVNIFIPSDADEYLTFVYGDWKTPKKDYSLDDYNNYDPNINKIGENLEK